MGPKRAGAKWRKSWLEKSERRGIKDDGICLALQECEKGTKSFAYSYLHFISAVLESGLRGGKDGPRAFANIDH